MHPSSRWSWAKNSCARYWVIAASLIHGKCNKSYSSVVNLIPTPSYNRISTLEAPFKENTVHKRGRTWLCRRTKKWKIKHTEILWQAGICMWAKPPKLPLLAQSKSNLGNTCLESSLNCLLSGSRSVSSSLDWFLESQVPGRQSYFTLLDIESIWANHITPYWICNCWQPITLHLIGYWTADTSMISQLIQVWMHNLDSQSYYNLLDTAALPANLVTTYWGVNKESLTW